MDNLKMKIKDECVIIEDEEQDIQEIIVLSDDTQIMKEIQDVIKNTMGYSEDVAVKFSEKFVAVFLSYDYPTVIEKDDLLK